MIHLKRGYAFLTVSLTVALLSSNAEKPSFCGFDPENATGTAVPYIPELDRNDVRIVQAQAFLRHGDRFFSGREPGELCWPGQEFDEFTCEQTETSVPTPTEESPTTFEPLLFRRRSLPQRNLWRGTCQIGQLTAKGRKQMLQVGTIFRQAYVPTLINPNYQEGDVFIRSTNTKRTILSAEAFAQGLYDSCSECTKKPNNQMVVDVWTMDDVYETMLQSHKVCPGLGFQFYLAASTTEFQIMYYQAQLLYADVADVVGVPIEQFNIEHVGDCLTVAMCRDYPLPDGITVDLFNQLEETFRRQFLHFLNWPNRVEGTKFTGGPILVEIHDRILKSIAASEGEPKIITYSGHDVGPMMLLRSAFGYNAEWPAYGSYMSIELYQEKTNNSEYWIRIVDTGVVIPVPGCSDPHNDGTCRFSEFEALIQPMMPSIEECPGMKPWAS